MGCKTAAKLNLYQCKMLVANGFLSKDMKTDYQHEEVIDRLLELQKKKDEQSIKNLMRHLDMISDEEMEELPPPIPAECDEGYDAQYDWMNS
jgi:hypothetical protein